MRRISHLIATLATLGFMNESEAQDSYQYEYLRIDAEDPTAVAITATDVSYSGGIIGPGVVGFGTALSANKIWFVQGSDSTNSRTDGIGVLHPKTLVFEQITTTGASMPARISFATTAIETDVFVFGGLTDGNTLSDELFSIGSSDYVITDLTPASSPPARFWSAMTRYGDDLVLFGGFSSDYSGLSDLWKFDRATGSWGELTPASGSMPGRAGHCMTILGDKLYVFGDANPSDSELHTYDFTTNAWSSAAMTPALTPQRQCSLIGAQHYDVDDVASDVLYLVSKEHGVTAIDVAAGTSESLVAGDSAANYDTAVIYGENQIMFMMSDGSTVTLKDFTITPKWVEPVDNGDGGEEGGFFSSPAGMAVILVFGAAVVYFLVLNR